jgi:hypothetical protein
MMSDKKGHIASFVFIVKVNKKETFLVQADSAQIADDGTLRFIVNNKYKSTVAAFNKYEYFSIESVNK